MTKPLHIKIKLKIILIKLNDMEHNNETGKVNS